MKLSFFQEPELEFGNGGTHVDIRYGLMRHGPLDLGETSAPSQLRVGFVGTEETITAIRQWFEHCPTALRRRRVSSRTYFHVSRAFPKVRPFRRPCSFTIDGGHRFDSAS